MSECTTDCRHGDHKEVNAVPVSPFHSVCEIGRISAVFKLIFFGGKNLTQSREKSYYQEYDARSSEPDRDKDGYELGKPWEGKFMRENYANFFHLIDVEVLSMLRYCRMSGTAIKRRARKNPNPARKIF